jgi:hypothetical protein
MSNKPKPNEPYIEKNPNPRPGPANQPAAKIIPAPIASTVEGAIAAAEKSVNEANKS